MQFCLSSRWRSPLQFLDSLLVDREKLMGLLNVGVYDNGCVRRSRSGSLFVFLFSSFVLAPIVSMIMSVRSRLSNPVSHDLHSTGHKDSPPTRATRENRSSAVCFRDTLTLTTLLFPNSTLTCSVISCHSFFLPWFPREPTRKASISSPR